MRLWSFEYRIVPQAGDTTGGQGSSTNIEVANFPAVDRLSFLATRASPAIPIVVSADGIARIAVPSTR